MVVDLAIHGERALAVVREERLVPRERIHDRQSLVSDRRASLAIGAENNVDARAVGAAMADEAL